ncbi:MAG: hypothetical protein A2X49_05410 [Lentisphaerae bacterium GWF2_52_8]|nr:MAG: hypothetical protein A2X49_05410 [Lentisphaerae bacterium GWF2_52_8]
MRELFVGRRKLIIQIYLFAALLPALLILLVSAWYGAVYAKSFYLRSVRENLEIRDRLSEPLFSELIENGEFLKLESLCQQLEAKSGTRFTVIDSSGKVLADSHENPEQMGDHSARPEIQEALKGKSGYSTRYSSTLDRSMMYVALPVRHETKIPYVLRVSVPLNTVTEVLSSVYAHIALAVLALAVLAGVLSFIVSRRISRPVEDIKKAARMIADGDLGLRLPIPDTDELAELAETLNSMAGQLQQRLDELTRERNEREAILSSMAEGLLAVDADSRIIKINHAAVELLRISGNCEGRTLHEVVRNASFQNFVEKVLHEQKICEDEFIFYDDEKLFLKARGAVLGNKAGAVIVLNDVSRLRQLEEIRRDFVANVSHEIKTPLTAIRAAVETLQDGAKDNPEDSDRFMKIITKHTDRLTALVEDILSLSNLEREEAYKDILLSNAPLASILSTAADLCKEKADARRVQIRTSCLPGIELRCERPLIEQALLNLLDNAVKYSSEGSSVEINGSSDARQISISVKDSGCGIPKEHLPRLFERFYRVDKARSRKLGGTGLGLAIVKHIVHVHKGSVSVESELGKGSIFTVRLPL